MALTNSLSVLGFTSNTINYNNSNGGPPTTMNGMQMNHMPMNVPVPPQQLPMGNNAGQMSGGSYTQPINMSQPPPPPPPPQQTDFG